MKKSFLVLGIFMILNLLLADTIVPGGAVVAEIWDLEGSPYLVQGDIDIYGLEIAPGVEIQMQGYFGIEIMFECFANGTEENPIIFTIADTTGFSDDNSTNGGWRGIILDYNFTINANLEYCIFEYTKEDSDYNSSVVYLGDYHSYSEVSFSNCIIRYSNRDCGLFINTNNVDIFNMEIHDCHTGISTINNSDLNLTVSNCTIYNTSIALKNIYNVTNCVFHDNQLAINLWGVWPYNTTVNIKNCLFYDNEYCIEGNNDTSFTCNILNCTFVDNFVSIFLNAEEWYHVDTNIINSIVVDSHYQINLDESGDNTILNTLVSETLDYSDYIQVENILNIDPIFVDASLNDFRLSTQSPCINYGTVDTTGLNLPEFDLDGNPRIYQGNNAIIDLGAYELQEEPIASPLLYALQNSFEFEDWSPISGYSPAHNLELFNTSSVNTTINSIILPTGYLIRQLGSITYLPELSDIIVTPQTIIEFEIVFAPETIGDFTDNIFINTNSSITPCIEVTVSASSDNFFHAGGIISEDTIWNYETIVIQSNIEISPEAILEIYPGTNILLDHVKFDIYGEIIAIGTKEEPIIFTGNSIWKGIKISSPENASQFEYCTIEKVRNNDYYRSAIFIENSPKTIFKNCNFNNNQNILFSASIKANNTSIEISDSIFEENISHNHDYDENFTDSGGPSAIKVFGTSSLFVSDTKFLNNISELGMSNNSALIYVDNENGTTTLLNCLFANNDSDYLIDAKNILYIQNCTISSQQGEISCYKNLELINSIIDGNCSMILLDDYPENHSAYVSYSNFSPEIFDDIEDLISLEGNIFLEPQFIDEENGNYSLFSSSPCIDSGTLELAPFYIPDYDLNDNYRVSGSSIDMGCYEYQFGLTEQTDIDFGDCRINENSNSQIITITNPIKTDILISAVISSTNFLVKLSEESEYSSSLSDITIPANSELFLSVVCNPKTLGLITGELAMYADTREFDSTINLQANGIDYSIALHQNYPNPFKQTTIIPFEVLFDTEITIEIYNIKGQKIKLIVPEIDSNISKYEITWDGTDQNSKTVASGIYIYKLLADNKTIKTKKMMLLK